MSSKSDRARVILEAAVEKSGPTGLVSADHFTDANRESLRRRDEALDGIASRSGTGTVFRDKTGKVMSQQDIEKKMAELKQKELERKADQRQMEWGTGLAQKMQRARFDAELARARGSALRNEEMDIEAEEELRAGARSLDPMTRMMQMKEERRRERREKRRAEKAEEHLQKEVRRREREMDKLDAAKREGTAEEYAELAQSIEKKRKRREEKAERKRKKEAEAEAGGSGQAGAATGGGRQEESKAGAAGRVRTTRPVYKGVPWGNRFGIRPGYRWDGIVRGIQWEDKIVAAASLKQAKAQRDREWRNLES